MKIAESLQNVGWGTKLEGGGEVVASVGNIKQHFTFFEAGKKILPVQSWKVGMTMQ